MYNNKCRQIYKMFCYKFIAYNLCVYNTQNWWIQPENVCNVALKKDAECTEKISLMFRSKYCHTGWNIILKRCQDSSVDINFVSDVWQRSERSHM